MFIERLYRKRFGRGRPEVIRMIEQVMAAPAAKKAAKRASKAASQMRSLRFLPGKKQRSGNNSGDISRRSGGTR